MRFVVLGGTLGKNSPNSNIRGQASITRYSKWSRGVLKAVFCNPDQMVSITQVQFGEVAWCSGSKAIVRVSEG